MQAAADPGISGSEALAARGLVDRLRGLGEVRVVRPLGETPGQMELDAAHHRADLFEAVPMKSGSFALAFSMQLAGMRYGSGLAAGVEGSALPDVPTTLSASTRFPFAGFSVSHTRLAPWLALLQHSQSALGLDGDAAALGDTGEPFDDHSAWHRVEILSLPEADLFTLRVSGLGRDTRRFIRTSRVPRLPPGSYRLGIWLFRYDDDRGEGIGSRVLVKDVVVTTFDR